MESSCVPSEALEICGVLASMLASSWLVVGGVVLLADCVTVGLHMSVAQVHGELLMHGPCCILHDTAKPGKQHGGCARELVITRSLVATGSGHTTGVFNCVLKLPNLTTIFKANFLFCGCGKFHSF